MLVTDWGRICWAHLLLNSFCPSRFLFMGCSAERYKKTTQQTLHAPALLPPSIFHPATSYLLLLPLATCCHRCYLSSP